jgi:hypothetical protein
MSMYTWVHSIHECMILVLTRVQLYTNVWTLRIRRPRPTPSDYHDMHDIKMSQCTKMPEALGNSIGLPHARQMYTKHR